MPEVQHLERGAEARLAFNHISGRAPTLVFLPGYMSDMAGTKALFISAWAAEHRRACLRLDYSGCGASEGEFAEGSIRRWAADARAVIDHAAPEGPLILIGSSMGGWIMLHLALGLRARVAGLVGIAAAPDFTRWGLNLVDADRATLATHGFVTRPSDYGPEPYRYHRALIADAEEAALLDGSIDISAPVRLLHGLEDTAVPWEVSLRLAHALCSADVRLTLVKGGDHRLSAPDQLALIVRTIEELAPCP
ncbi:MAG: alpha/beta fold hydrolase [Thermaurantiacus sp.]